VARERRLVPGLLTEEDSRERAALVEQLIKGRCDVGVLYGDPAVA
jgi:hypothetical protein